MCGIFGVLINEKTGYSPPLLGSVINELFILSESRGKEASGIAVSNNAGTHIYKEGIIASSFIRSKGYRQFLNKALNKKSRAAITGPIAIIGHTRLATNGPQADNDNNCPIVSGNVIGVHNGIVVNDDELWKTFSFLERRADVDSRLIFSLLSHLINSGLPFIKAVQELFSKIEGSASIAAMIPPRYTMILATNTGSLYACRNRKNDTYIFASESRTLQTLAGRFKSDSIIDRQGILQVKAGRGRIINLYKLTEEEFNLNQE